MIQRFQSLLFFFAFLTLLIIVFYFPVLVVNIDDQEKIFLLLADHFSFVRLFIFLSAGLSLFSISQYKNRKRQILMSSVARLMITLAFVSLVFLYRESEDIGVGLFLLIIPYTSLFLATYFIRKDERVIKDADRLR